jgi:LuxR family maltose regulon positive regulatory protein
MTAKALLTTRFELPALRPNLVARPRLIGHLNEGLSLSRRLTLVAAPAGFGKTTLIGEWIEAIDRPVAWLSIDEEINDPETFLSYLLAALQQADSQLGSEVQSLLGSPQPAPEQELVAALINDLSSSKTELILVLDDYHLVSSFAIHNMLSFLLENQPAGFHMVVGTREDPPLPLARLRARGQISEIRERALRFTPEEAGTFLNETMKLGLPVESVDALEVRTEGWAAGLQLAALAMQEERDKERAQAFITAFAGDDRYVIDYLMAEVLQRQPAEIRHFLRQTAVLDKLTAPLCEALLGHEEPPARQTPTGSQPLLEHLDRANLFIIPLDHRRQWYRYHRLFAEALRSTLSLEERQQLHQRASKWYEANGFSKEARHHARAYAQASHPTTDALEQVLVESLSERELEVLYLIAAGHRNKEIAQKLYITTGTVKRHTNHIYGKLGVHSRTEAVARGRDLGLI